MKKSIFLLLFMFFIGGTFAAEKVCKENMLQVTRKGTDILIKSHFNDKYYLLQDIRLGNYNHQINFVKTQLQDKKSSETILVHSCIDDSTPMNLNSTYIGANHGCSDGDTITLKNHPFTEKDLGKALHTGKPDGQKTYIIAIIDKNRFATLTDPFKNPRRPWSFSRTGARKNSVTLFDNGKAYEAKNTGIFQYRPCLRFHYQKYIADGKELKDGETVNCKNFRIEESYDILRPESMLEKQKANIGKKVNLLDPSIKGVVTTRLAYDFAPTGVCIVEHYSKALCDFYMAIHGVIQSSSPNSRAFDRKGAHIYYIPKTVPFNYTYKGKKYSLNFLKGENFFRFPWPSVTFSEKNNNIADINNPPDSAIQFLGKKDKEGKFVPVFGYALGYSMTEGDTIPAIRKKQAKNFWWVHSTRKTYPSASGSIRVKAGKEFHSYAYRQYFDAAPRKDISGNMYYHKLKDSWYIYLDYQKTVKEEFVKFPAYLKGKKINIVEKTPSVSFKPKADGILLTVNDSYGRLVLQLK